MYTEEIVYGAYKFLDSLRETAKDMYKNARAAVKQKMYRWKVPAVKRAAFDARKMHDTVSFEGVNLFKKIQRTATLLKNTVRDRSIAERQALITLARLQYAMRGKYIHKGGLSHYQLQMQYGTIVSNGVFALTQDWTDPSLEKTDPDKFYNAKYDHATRCLSDYEKLVVLAGIVVDFDSYVHDPSLLEQFPIRRVQNQMRIAQKLSPLNETLGQMAQSLYERLPLEKSCQRITHPRASVCLSKIACAKNEHTI